MGFFDEHQTPAVVKHGLLRRYCPAFAYKAGSRTGGRVTFLDGYAGAGSYDDESEGSPLILMQAARSVSNRQSVNGIFIEQDETTYRRLEQVLGQHCQGLDYTCLPGDVDQHLDQVMLACRHRALFAFFDPFGPALGRRRLRGLLAQRARANVPTDVLVHVSVRSVWNFGSRLTNATRQGQPLSASDAVFAERLDRFLGDGWWREHFERAGQATDDEADERPAQIALRVADEYAAQLAAETGYQTVSMQVRRRPHHVPIYVLTLFTRHPDGTWLFADCIGKAALDWEHAWREADLGKEGPDGQTTLFAAAGEVAFDREKYERDHHHEWVSIIAENVDRLLSQHRPLVLAEHVAEVFGRTLGTGAQHKHARAAIKLLHQQGRVDHNGKGGQFHRDRMLRPNQPQQGPALAG